MDEMISDFYITLPSNSSMDYFPHNTQSSYRTKLSSPLMLTGEWQVGLAEIFIPRNWFNIGGHNNTYIITIEKEERIPTDHLLYEVTYSYDPQENNENMWWNLNTHISQTVGVENCVRFTTSEDGSKVLLNLLEGFEIHIKKEHASKLLYMLQLPNKDAHITESTEFNFRSTTQPHSFTLQIVNKNPKSKTEHIIPINSIKATPKPKGVFNVINDNIQLLDLQNFLKIEHEPIKNEVRINISEHAELKLMKSKAPTFMRKLNVGDDCVLRGAHTFVENPLILANEGEILELTIKEYHKVTKKEKRIEHLTLNIGMYKTPSSLFKEFKCIELRQLPNLKVSLHVPSACEVNFGKGLADLLGFKSTHFKSGNYISEYPLELDAGISEIFVYSDIIQSSHVGDSFSPLLRVIPCMSEMQDQIVKHYPTPIYFPLRNNFVESIEIELKTSSGNDIIFTGGKTFVLLSFRRKKL